MNGRPARHVKVERPFVFHVGQSISHYSDCGRISWNLFLSCALICITRRGDTVIGQILGVDIVVIDSFLRSE